METLAAGVWRSIEARRTHAVLIAHGGTNRTLAIWLPRAMFKVLRLAVRREIELALTGDVSMNAVVSLLLRPFGVPCVTMAMGLDVTYPNRLYRLLTRSALRRSPSVIAISEATAEEVRRVGTPPDRVAVLRLGVPTPGTPALDRQAARAALEDRLGLGPGQILVATLGRLVARKGVSWFIGSVLPRLPAPTHYVVAGDGPESEAIADAVISRGLKSRVHVLGRVSDEVREEILSGADMFVQPNLPIPGDMEGFGLVTVEAAIRETLVLAADLEGLRDAIVDGKTGILLPAGDAMVWAETLGALLSDPAHIAELGASYGQTAARLYSEDEMAASLDDLLRATPSS
jgi:phosphatidyl-myo-inositol dimannoside synthase